MIRIKQKGGAFTLIEIMIVMSIVLIVMTTGVPMMMRHLSKNQLSKAVYDVLEGCKTARDRAILQNRPWDFVIRNLNETDAIFTVEPANVRDPSTQAAGAGLVANTTTTNAAAPDPISLVGGFPREMGHDIAVEMIGVNFVEMMGAAESRVRFYPNGTCDEFAMIMSHNGERRTIKVDIITGAAFEVAK